MISQFRHHSALDRILAGIGHGLATAFAQPEDARPSPADAAAHADLDNAERRHVGGLMRINHTGEVCAQALYLGQALVARDNDTRQYLEQSAAEETDHLAWCHQRLVELECRPSLFNPLWYAGSYAIGVAAAAANDRVSLGFVVETERQVEAHLGQHIERLPAQDLRSRAILEQMQTDEARHGRDARERGGIDLPRPVRGLMRAASGVMKAIAYRL